MEEILETLSQTHGVQASLIVGKDGLVIHHSGDVGGLDPHLLGATTSEIFTTAESMLGERFDHGDVELLQVESAKGKLVMTGINDVTFLLVMARPKVNLGLVRWEIRAAAERLKEVL